MADPTLREARGEGEICGLCRDHFLPLLLIAVVCDRAGGIEKDVVRSPVARRVNSQCELMARGKIDVEFGVRRIADLRGRDILR